MSKVGFFGGTFDPIHFGHINLALEMLEKHGLNKILFCPASENPLKSRDNLPIDATHRLKMTQLALQDIPEFELLDYEAANGGVSYTVETLRWLKSNNPTDNYYLILGLDNVASFVHWKNPDEILNLATPLVGLRDYDRLDKNVVYYKNFEKGVTKTRLLDISSTVIRQRIQEEKYIGHLAPPKVVDYIYHNHIYLNSL
jgi:nicotinate-nucleotide adenylyltransferase